MITRKGTIENLDIYKEMFKVEVAINELSDTLHRIKNKDEIFPRQASILLEEVRNMTYHKCKLIQQIQIWEKAYDQAIENISKK